MGYWWGENENMSKKLGRKMLEDINSEIRGTGWKRGAG